MNELRKSYDAVIIGAGVGGGAMANRLAEAGATVLVIERGTRLPREADNWSVKAVFHEKRYATKETWRDRNGQEFNPSTYYYVGGNSKFFGTATLRFRAEDFEDLQHEAGVAPAWPIRYADLAPYYDVAERLMGTHGTAGMDPCEPPRSGPMPHPAIGHEPEIAVIRHKACARWGLKPFPLPVAIDLHPGGNCIRCRTCDGFACKLGAKNDAEVRLVDPAIATGNVDLILETQVHRLITDDTGRKVVGVEVEQKGQKPRHQRRSLHLQRRRHQFGGAAAALGQRQASQGSRQQQFRPAGPQLHGPQQHGDDGRQPVQEEQRGVPEVAVHQRLYLANSVQALSARQCAGPGQAAGRHAHRQHEGHARMADELVRRRAASTGGSCRRICPTRTTASPSTATARSAWPTRPTISSPMANW